MIIVGSSGHGLIDLLSYQSFLGRKINSSILREIKKCLGKHILYLLESLRLPITKFEG